MFGQPLLILLLLGLTAAQAAPPIPSNLRDLSRAYQASGKAQDRAALERAVDALPAAARPLGALALGAAEHQLEHWTAAAAELKPATATAATPLADYATYFRGRAFAKAEQHGQAALALQGFAGKHPSSRLKSAAARLRAESLIREGRFDEARAALSDKTAVDPAAQAFFLGRILHLEGKLRAAVQSYRRAYYYHPLSDQAAASEQRLSELRRTMGDRYPQAPAAWRLARADLLFAAGKYPQAASEYARAYPLLKGAERDRARLRQAAASYRRLHTTTAQNLLANLKLADPELDAERLYYLGQCARRKKQITRFKQLAEELGRKHPDSPWYEEALFSLGNFYLLENDTRQYRSYYERAAREFPQGQYAARAHWKVCWRAYLDADPRSRALFDEHVRLYPASGQASAALYWLARLAERDGDPSTAKGLYQAIDARFPNYYYGLLARQRLAAVGKANRPPSPKLSALLAALPSPRRISTAPLPQTTRVIERGRLLFQLGLDDFAEKELLTANYRQADGHLAGLELARQSAARNDHFRAMRHMKRYGFGYLRLTIESMPREFWKRLYPLPYEKDLRARTKPHALDPYLIAGLIRQESEFNPTAVSRAGAIGLMQLMPATGRELARRLNVARFTTRRLREPDISLRLGSFHFKQVVARFQGDLELSLAAYNAGESRADRWVTWGDFDEPGEFVETIPFTETRGYVQSVLRNRDMYRRLYGASAPSRARLLSGE